MVLVTSNAEVTAKPLGTCSKQFETRDVAFSQKEKHDNVKPHTAANTQAVLDSFECEILDHTVYTRWPCTQLLSYLPPSQTSVGGSRNDDDDEVNTAVNSWLSEQTASYDQEG